MVTLLIVMAVAATTPGAANAAVPDSTATATAAATPTGPTVPALSSSAGPAAPVLTVAAPPAGFTKHTSRYWTWFGPASWIGSYGAYGITVSSPTGIAVRDYGGSSTLCVRGATWKAQATSYFAGRRTQTRVGSGATAWKWRTVGEVTLVGTRMYRQVNGFEATVNGKAIRGKLIFQYGDNGGGYCFGSADSRTAPTARYVELIKTLDAIAAHTTYLGPGV